jgi:hypothetical protein
MILLYFYALFSVGREFIQNWVAEHWHNFVLLCRVALFEINDDFQANP